MPRISSLPQAVSASVLDEFPIVQGNITKRVNFLTAQLSGLFLPLDGSISTAKLAANAVSAAKLASDISNDSNRAVTVNHIQTAAVDDSKLAVDSVITSKIKDLNVTGPKLAVGALSISKFNTIDKQFLIFAGSSRPGTAVATSGGIENVVVYNGGSGYSTGSPPAVTFTPASPTGDNATATAVVDPATGTVSSITVTYAGSGYTEAPSVVIVSGTTQAKAVAYCCLKGISANDSNNCFGGGAWRAGFFITADKKAKAVGTSTNFNLAKGNADTNSWLPSECGFYSSVSTPNSFIKASKIYSSYASTFLIDTNGQLYGAGRNDVGQLGDGTNVGRHSFLKNPYSFNNAPIIRMDMHQGTYYPTVAALTATGEIWLWGYNNGGECGVGNANNVLIPNSPLPSVYVTDFSLGGNNYGTSYLVSATGNVYVCGMGNYGQRSQGLPATNSNSFTTLKITGGGDFTNAKKVVGIGGSGTYAYNTVAILTNAGTVFCAGYGANGQLGNGLTNNTSALNGYVNQVSGLTGVVDIAGSVSAYSGPSCFFAIKSNGDVVAWGNNGQGSWGIGSGAVNANYSTPQTIWNAVARGAGAVKITQGGDGYTNASCYLLDTLGRLWCAGYNGNGNLGDGTTTNRPDWQVFRLNNEYKILDFKLDGYDTTINPRVLCEDGKVYTCGYNDGGQLASGDNYARYMPSGMIF